MPWVHTELNLPAEGGFTLADVDVVRRETVYQGFYRLDCVRLRHRLFAGGTGPEIKREVFIRPPAAGVLIYDPVLDNVLLIEQFRIGALESDCPWQLEIVAGLLEAGETPESLVRREALEEAGVKLLRVEPVMTFLTSPGGSNERFTLLAAEADLSAAGGIHGLPEEGEDIRVRVMMCEDAFRALRDNRMDNAPGILALQWLQMHREALRARWLI